MSVARSADSRWRLGIVGVALAFVLFRSTWKIFQETVVHEGLDYTYTLGDWLTNYSGGIIRRGLSGTILMSLPLSANILEWAVFASIVLITLAFLLVVFLLFRQTTRSNAWVMLVLSPAFALFLLWSFPGGPRKELIGAVLLGALALLIRKFAAASSASRAGNLAVVGLAVLYLPVILVHEVTLAYIPAAVAMVWLNRGVLSPTTLWAAMVGWGLSVMAAFFVMATSTRGVDIGAVCARVVERGIDRSVCGGSIRDLGVTASEAFANQVSFFPPYFFYASLAVLAVLPAYLAGGRRRDAWILAATVVVLLPEIVFGGDYGRWIFVATAALSFTLLSRTPRQLGSEHAVPAMWAVAYLLLWRVPTLGDNFAESFLTQGYRWIFDWIRDGKGH